MSGLLGRARSALRDQQQAYAAQADDERPLGGYVAAIGGFTVLTSVVGALTLTRGRPLTLREIALVGVATHKLARIISKDAVTSPLRAPFTSYQGPGSPGEVMEEVRGHGARHAVGELLTCPFCLSPWVATSLVGGFAVAPELTRLVVSVFGAVTVSDGLQFAYAALEKASE